ncbi:PLP-dependent aminotransferase family protein (plasmid) [Paracoccus denitrificans]|uniref:MocR-like pyridoxine biosynthesis transcription factor PdxR n=1 Tax=Paracoccus denitrificans TaxID=266 RepID=UPI001E31BCB3|nr:PLP-dependent aminotransferase family protein [Paracoccus denitrificans]UFS68115.1 PLP-dependent aminotransferase family protein [Paracoccus denitrificans]
MVQLRKDPGHPPAMGARQIYEALREQIAGGVFGAAGRLPSSRVLAHELGVSRTTVTAAYEQLLAEGFIEVRQGSRARVAPDLAEPARRKDSPGHPPPVRLSAWGERIRRFHPAPSHAGSRLLADFRYGDMAAGDFPATLWKRSMSAAMSRQPERLTYADPRGTPRLRAALQGYLWRARQMVCEPDQIVIVNGSQQGLDLCARLILDPGDAFAIENPCYAMARQVLAGTGAMPVSIPVDAAGLRTEALDGVRARLAYVTPSHQFPLGGVMPVRRRQQLLDWARQNHAWVIEDDYDSEYRFDINPVPALHGLDGGDRVIYLGTLSKTLSPLLRIGYLVVPAALNEAMAAAKRLADRHSPVVEQEALAALIETGAYERHVRRIRRLNGERRATLITALRRHFADRIVIEGADAGLHLVIWFRDLPRDRETALLEGAKAKGVGLHSISWLYDGTPADRPDHVGLVMGYAAVEPKLIERAVRLLAGVVETL